MADEKAPEQVDEQVEQAAPETDTTDWRAKYEDAIRHSREWEKRSKANAAAAKELDELKTANLSESQKMEKTIAELKAENAAMKLAEQKREWVVDVERKTGVPADVLAGAAATSLDELSAFADSIKAHFKTDAAPVVPTAGKTAPNPAPAQGAAADFAAFMNSNFSK